MWGSSRWARSAQTTIPCKHCGNPLTVVRSCQVVYMQCEHCKKKGELNDYIAQMDDALEEFMEGVYCDRV
ncbi:hypothetical protein LN040_04100 [Desulfovibrio subterraneus]|jgi:hypothetical protein|uniref:Uncharacterized protein n=1 Tax=Desulfovibrio subterraneus TaxID=2718620 RepID=A0A7J0BKN2_9BACT|nr:dual CXXC motif small (seleno)protein [Desulfovibrio subterraneus]WBF68296.1 hypothetical protein LN040_04100 [Desulfovibrio subterraneus]GFM34246.1 hypothetical protein DSM101010T_26110 [Desulfovibrio subterraneus]